jgi:hypothetical protein
MTLLRLRRRLRERRLLRLCGLTERSGLWRLLRLHPERLRLRRLLRLHPERLRLRLLRLHREGLRLRLLRLLHRERLRLRLLWLSTEWLKALRRLLRLLRHHRHRVRRGLLRLLRLRVRSAASARDEPRFAHRLEDRPECLGYRGGRFRHTGEALIRDLDLLERLLQHHSRGLELREIRAPAFELEERTHRACEPREDLEHRGGDVRVCLERSEDVGEALSSSGSGGGVRRRGHRVSVGSWDPHRGLVVRLLAGIVALRCTAPGG